MGNCCLTARTVFIRIFWLTKLRPVLEYSASTWMGNVSKSVMEEIDKLQMKFLRRSLGLPSFTKGTNLLMELGIQRQSLRLQGVKIKYFFRVFSGTSPVLVQKTLKDLQQSKSCLYGNKNFVGETKRDAILKRSNWARKNTYKLILGKQTAENFFTKLESPLKSAKYGYWRLYPNSNKCKKIRWKCTLPILKSRADEGVFCKINTRETILQAIYDRGVCDKISKGDEFMREVRLAIQEWVQKVQIETFEQGRGEFVKLREKGWYWDPQLFLIDISEMRLFRKLRLGVSELAEHSFFLNENNKKCQNCSSGRNETLEHYFLECPKYSKIREKLFKEIKDIWGQAERINLKIILGFFKGVSSRKFRQKTKVKRRLSYRATCKYIRDTSRFIFL